MEEEDSHIRISTKSAIAILVAVLSFGGFNLYNGQQMMTAENGQHLEARVKDLQKMIRAFSPDTQKDTQDSTHRIRGLMVEFAAKEEGVRRQHIHMSAQIDAMAKVLTAEGPSDERFHRSMDKLESMLREILRNQRKSHPEGYQRKQTYQLQDPCSYPNQRVIVKLDP
jgi:hypothetical protein